MEAKLSSHVAPTKEDDLHESLHQQTAPLSPSEPSQQARTQYLSWNWPACPSCLPCKSPWIQGFPNLAKNTPYHKYHSRPSACRVANVHCSMSTRGIFRPQVEGFEKWHFWATVWTRDCNHAWGSGKGEESPGYRHPNCVLDRLGYCLMTLPS